MIQLILFVVLYFISFCHADDSDSLELDIRRSKEDCKIVYSTCSRVKGSSIDYWTKIKCVNDEFRVDWFEASDGATGCGGTPSRETAFSLNIRGCKCNKVGFVSKTSYYNQGCTASTISTWDNRYIAFQYGPKQRRTFCDGYELGCHNTALGSYYIGNVVGCDNLHREENEEREIDEEEFEAWQKEQFPELFATPIVPIDDNEMQGQAMSDKQMISAVGITVVLLSIGACVYKCCIAKNNEESECKALLSDEP